MAITNYYVDPAIAGNSGTGTIGDPFGDLQYALNTVTRDATNGDQFNIKAGTDEVLTASLSLASYGTPTITAPLVFRGYTSAANDGGIGGVSGAGSYSIINNSTLDYIMFYDMHLHNTGLNIVVRLDDYCYFYNCEIDNSTTSGLYLGGQCKVVRCYVHNTGDYGVNISSGTIHSNFIKNGTNKFNYAIQAENAAIIQNNIISVDSSSVGIIPKTLSNDVKIMNNTIYSSSGTGIGIECGNTRLSEVSNNIVVGFSGVGGIGIQLAGYIARYGHNKCYNNATNFDDNSTLLLDNMGNNDVLLASPFTDPANDDFSVDTTVQAGAYPSTFNGSNTNQYLDVGAAQRQEAASGGGGRRPRGRYHGV